MVEGVAPDSNKAYGFRREATENEVVAAAWLSALDQRAKRRQWHTSTTTESGWSGSRPSATALRTENGPHTMHAPRFSF